MTLVLRELHWLSIWRRITFKTEVLAYKWTTWYYLGESVALLVARQTNNRKVVGLRPTKVVCITVLTGNHLGWTICCGQPPLLPSCRKLEFRLSALLTRIWHG